MRDKHSPLEKELYRVCLSAAEAGNAKAMCEVARRLYDGIGIPKDRDSAYAWYRKSAEAGNRKAMRVTAFLYQNDLEDTAANKETAIRWYLKAGDEESLCNAATMYAVGTGIPQDEARAMEILSQVDEETAATAMVSIGNGLKGMERVSWLERAAAKGSVIAMHELGTFYANEDKETPADFALAYQWFAKGAEKGYAPSMSRIGDFYYVGDGVEQDDEIALCWYEKAAAQGFHPAMMQVGRMYYMGRGTKQDFGKAMDMFMDVATTREPFFMVVRYNSLARQYIARMHQRGEGVPQDMTEAFKWYQAAAEDSRNTEALYTIADMYYMGRGTAQDLDKALAYYQKAAQNNREQRGREAARKAEMIEKVKGRSMTNH